MVRMRAWTLISSPWTRTRCAPSRMSAPSVAGAWYPTKSTVESVPQMILEMMFHAPGVTHAGTGEDNAAAMDPADRPALFDRLA